MAFHVHNISNLHSYKYTFRTNYKLKISIEKHYLETAYGICTKMILLGNQGYDNDYTCAIYLDDNNKVIYHHRNHSDTDDMVEDYILANVPIGDTVII